jgi:hypothetical protein
LDVPCQKYEENINLFERIFFILFCFYCRELKKEKLMNYWFFEVSSAPLLLSLCPLLSIRGLHFDFICTELKVAEDDTRGEGREFLLVGIFQHLLFA